MTLDRDTTYSSKATQLHKRDLAADGDLLIRDLRVVRVGR